jgi:transcriptional regulator with GAF, ATPase, and Fis domain
VASSLASAPDFDDVEQRVVIACNAGHHLVSLRLTRVMLPARIRPDADRTDVARRIAALSADLWGHDRAVHIVGLDASMLAVQQQLLQFAQADSPVLISGETGTGKELFARSLYLLSDRVRHALICVNCAQYHETPLLASELFGHRRGSFTGSLTDRAGAFEEADQGVVFLDEIAELSPPAQAMLLRTLSEGEIVRVGENRARHVDVRIIAASARDLGAMVNDGRFRADLYYRLRFLRLTIPPLRVRGDDWRLLVDHVLERLNTRRGCQKRFSGDALRALERCVWPGNVRELRSVVELAFFSTTGDVIETGCLEETLVPSPESVATQPMRPERPPEPRLALIQSPPRDVYHRLVIERRSFWESVYHPFMTRELSRRDVSALIERGLREAGGSYRDLLTLFGVPQVQYQKFMDFLRHQRLKPSQGDRLPPRSGTDHVRVSN